MSNIDDTNITMNFDLQLLRCFEALMAERSVSRAAVKLNLSEPAMGHALGRLRALFDAIRSTGNETSGRLVSTKDGLRI